MIKWYKNISNNWKYEKKSIVWNMASLEILKTLKYHIFSRKHFIENIFLLFVISVAVNIKEYLKKNNQLKYLKIIGLMRNT